MIGLDTNVLLRIVVDDDPAQNERARRFATSAEPASLFVSDIVMVELVWTLRRRLRLSKPLVVTVLRRLVDRPEFVFEDRDAMTGAVESFDSLTTDFSDILIAAKGRAFGASATVSFDEVAIDDEVLSPLPP